MEITTQALVCAVRPHGEHGAIARLLTPEAGLIAGYVRGGRSRAIRPVLIPGNKVNAHFRARHSDQLASLSVELIESRAPLWQIPWHRPPSIGQRPCAQQYCRKSNRRMGSIQRSMLL